MKEHKELHYRYALSYLLIALILLLALGYYDVPNLVDKFSFALTLSSLLLAVLAIFFTIISAQKQDLQLTKLIETNANLDGAAEEIKLSSQEIRSFAKEAPKHFQTLGDKIDTLSTNHGALDPTLLPDEIKNAENAEINISDSQFMRMFGRLQFSAMAVLYLFTRSFQKGKIIEHQDFDNFEFTTSDYASGVLTGLETTGIISYELHNEAIIPTNCSESVKNQIKVLFESVIAVVEDEKANDLRSYMEAVEKFVY